MSPPRFPSRLRFASLLAYSPGGNSAASRRSRRATLGIKGGRPAYIARFGVLMRELFDAGSFQGPDVTLVPVPRRAPLVSGSLWPASRICAELLRRGLSADVAPLLVRCEAVPKSAFQRSCEKRPGPAEHAATLTLAEELAFIRGRVVLVDDVVTRGATFLGAAGALASAIGDAEIVAFAVARTMSRTDLGNVVDPIEGEISIEAWGPQRRP